MMTHQKCSLSRAAILLVLGACGCDAGTAQEGPVPVRHREGTLHGFLLLRTLTGDTLGHGDLLQVHRDSVIESRVSFVLRDGSRYEETVAFTQDSVFRMRRYHLLQRGPAFPADAEYTMDGTGHYRVESQGREDARPEVEEGRLDLPADVSNGLIPILVKNLEPDAEWNVHFVAFTPEPKLIGLRIRSVPAPALQLGEHVRTTRHVIVTAELGALRGFFAALVGKSPPDNHVWIVTQDVPIFVRSESPLFVGGPVWRIDVTTPGWPAESGL